MKRNITTISLLAMAMAVQAQQFTVSGKIDSIKKGCEVKIVGLDGYKKHEIAKGVTDDGGFTLTGNVAGPTLATITINDKPQYGEREYPQDRGVTFMLENVPVTIEAAHFDSIPRSYELGDTPLRLERNVRVTGGDAQRHYQEWRNYIYDAELAAWHAGHVLWLYRFHDDENKKQKDRQTTSLMEKAANAAQSTVDHLNGKFIAKHPSYAVCLVLQQKRMDDMFKYTDAELDSILTLMKDNEDKPGYERLKAKTAELRKFTKGTPYTDFDVKMADGTVKRFSDCIVKGSYNYIDMWASWCGPCRAAIPAVKELHKKMGSRLNIVSVSVDKDEAAWQRAMGEEQMPWTQLIATKESIKTLQEAYNLSSIPYLLIIDPEGRIVLSTHEPDVADEFFVNMIR